MNPERNAKPTPPTPSTLDQWLERLDKPPLKNVESAGERIWQALLANADETREGSHLTPPPDAEPVKFRSLRLPMLAVAATVVLLFVLSPVLVRSIVLRAGGARAVVVEGALSRVAGERANPLQTGQRIGPGVLRSTGDKGAVIALADGSRVEMRSESELLLERADDGVRIRLNKGGVIVNAAKQRQGHLYVQTKDVTVSVVGTVFLVNAEEEGSHVAVIEGEVRVQHGVAERKLRPGEQVATGPSMEPQPVTEEISWSRNAAAHAVLLAQSSAASAAAKAGNVTGVVRTYGGSPASRVRVGAMRADSIDDALRAIAALAETDSMGRYRLENVPPGNYYITAGRANLPTYYPGTLEIAKGTVVSITAAATISDIDFVLQDTSRPLPPRARSVRGHVVLDPDFSPVVASQQSPDRQRVRVLESEGQPARFVATAWTDEELERRLGLTEDQRKQIADIADQYLKVFLQNKSNFEREEGILKRMTAPDSKESPKAISLQNDRVLAARKLWEAANDKTVGQILSILTEPQKQKLRAEVPAGGMRLGGLPIEEFLVLLQGSPGSPN